MYKKRVFVTLNSSLQGLAQHRRMQLLILMYIVRKHKTNIKACVSLTRPKRKVIHVFENTATLFKKMCNVKIIHYHSQSDFDNYTIGIRIYQNKIMIVLLWL